MKLEESSNTPIKKPFEVAINKEEIVIDEFRMQVVMELILEQLVGLLKEVEKARKEPMHDFSRQKIIVIRCKHEESYNDIIRIARISFKFKELKNLILLQDSSLQEERAKQLTAC